MSLEKVCRDIKTLKVQGAIGVARAATIALYEHSKTLEGSTVKIESELKKAAIKLVMTRPTEPALRNALSYFFYKLNMTSVENMRNHIELKFHSIMDHFSQSEEKIIEIAKNKIRDGTIVYTHCHSSTVTKILVAAKKAGKNFEVHNTETRPLFQGRKTAKELSEAGIKVTLYVDSAAKHAMKKADLVLLGCDAITTTKVINKVGSETIAILAAHYDIPVFCCTDSWKFDPQSIIGFDSEIEKRAKDEVWKNPPKGVEIYSAAFDQINPNYITGIISEIGVYNHSMFIDEIQDELVKRSIKF